MRTFSNGWRGGGKTSALTVATVSILASALWAPTAISADAALGFPYEYVGRVVNVKDSVYLNRGNTMSQASQGVVLDNTFRVEEVTSNHIDVTHIATGQKQRILLSLIAADSGNSHAVSLMPRIEVTVDLNDPKDQALIREAPEGMLFKVQTTHARKTQSASVSEFTKDAIAPPGSVLMPAPHGIDDSMPTILANPNLREVTVNLADPKDQALIREAPAGVLFKVDPSYAQNTNDGKAKTPYTRTMQSPPGAKMQTLPNGSASVF